MSGPDRQLRPEVGLLAVLREENDALGRLAGQLARSAGAARRDPTVQLLARVARHRRLTVHHVDPLIRRYVPGGLRQADDQLAHLAALDLLALQLRRDTGDGPGTDTLVQGLLARLDQHLTQQWQVVIPLLTEHVPATVLDQRGALSRAGH